MAKEKRPKIQGDTITHEVTGNEPPIVFTGTDATIIPAIDHPTASEPLNEQDIQEEVNNKPIIEEKVVANPVPFESTGALETPKPTYRKELDATFSFEQRIMAYLATRNTSDYVRINDFLKSLYGVPVFNEPQKWSLQTESKKLRVTLENMRANGLFTVKDNAHMRLAAQYYEGEQQYTKHHTLNTISIEVKI
jgi:hypothetical protein